MHQGAPAEGMQYNQNQFFGEGGTGTANVINTQAYKNLSQD